jgi:hypothetical protein
MPIRVLSGFPDACSCTCLTYRNELASVELADLCSNLQTFKSMRPASPWQAQTMTQKTGRSSAMTVESSPHMCCFMSLLALRFWLAVSEAVRGQAMLALVRPGAQDEVCGLSLRRAALDSLVVAARFASFVKKVSE